MISKISVALVLLGSRARLPAWAVWVLAFDRYIKVFKYFPNTYDSPKSLMLLQKIYYITVEQSKFNCIY